MRRRPLSILLTVGLVLGAPLSLAVAGPASSAAAASSAYQVSYIDKGQVWVSTLDGRSKRSISGSVPSGSAWSGRKWTEQTQSTDGWIAAVARKSGGTGAAAPTRLWKPDGTRARDGSLGYDPRFPSAIMPVGLDLSTGGKQLVYGWSYLQYGFPTSTLHLGTWVANTAHLSLQPYNIANLTGASLAGNRMIGINHYASSSENNIMVQKPGSIFEPNFSDWFHVTRAWSVDAAANGSVVAALWEPQQGGVSQALALFSTSRIGGAIPSSCDVPAVGSVDSVSVAPDGKSLAWVDDRGLMAARMPALTVTPCAPISPVRISASGTMPAIGATKLATRSTPAKKVTPTVTSKLAPKKVKRTARAKLTVTVRASGRATSSVTGKVSVKSGSKRLGSGTVVRGKATIKLKRISKVGTHRLTVSYSGNSRIAARTVKVALRVTR